jgi:hypothetical protein
VDYTTGRPTVWVPAYRPPSKLVKMQVRDSVAGSAHPPAP